MSLSLVDQTIIMNVIGFVFAFDVWENLASIFEGDKKIKSIKMQNLKHKFETLNMSKDEKIEGYAHKLNEFIKSNKYIGGTHQGNEVVLREIQKLYQT